MQAVILLSAELQLRVEGSNNYHFFNKIFEKVFLSLRVKD